MLNFIAWYLLVTLLGLLTFPLAYYLFPALSDRGYSMSRALGLLLWAFLFWFPASVGLLQNDPGGLLFGLVALTALVLWALWKIGEGEITKGWSVILGWLKANFSTVLTVEVLFLLAFAAWAFVRANNPDTTGTEKPMEMAFINAILHSRTFPPHDPWLSGYAISYYYFGYIMTAMLAMFTGTSGGVAFNLMLSLIFALSVVGAYGLVYNLLRAYWHGEEAWNAVKQRLRNLLMPLFAPLFLVILGNWEGSLEVLHKAGIGWTFGANGQATSAFWSWLNIQQLSDPPTLPLGWIPTRYWWWWRASRVIDDYDLLGNYREIIDEFPMFSYLLGDLHPHVLAMPFGLLAVGLALNLFLGGWRGETNLHWFKIPVRREGFALMAVALGGMAFLNTWDFPTYLALASGALVLSRVHDGGWRWKLLEDFATFAIPLGIASLALYLPFYVTFSSQAGGILPNILYPTRGAHLWVMFGGLFVPLFLFLIYRLNKQPANWRTGILLAVFVTLFLWLLSTVLGIVASGTDIGQQFISSQGLSSLRSVLSEATLRRLQYGGGLLTMLALIGAATAYLTGRKPVAPALDDSETEEPVAMETAPVTEDESKRSPIPFVMMLILFGGLIVLAPDFIYLQDQFGYRINTVFKFYYQAWALWSVAAAFGVALMLMELRNLKSALYTAAIVVVVAIGLVYPVLGIPNKTNNFAPPQRTLDGAAYLTQQYSPDDAAAIAWLSSADPGVVAEAIGGGYSQYARVSTYSGQPTVLGWPDHEGQWRGGYAEQGSRESDIKTMYTTSSWDLAYAIMQQYHIQYVYVGPLERQTYTVSEQKFSDHMSIAYQQGQVTIYELP